MKLINTTAVVLLATVGLLLLLASRASASSNGTEARDKEGEDDNAEMKKRLEMIKDFINKYILPIIVGVGVIGNTITIIILIKENELNSIYNSSKSFRHNLHFQYAKRSANIPEELSLSNIGTKFAV